MTGAPGVRLHGALLVCEFQMDAATPITLVSLGDSSRAMSKSLWHLLVTWCDGKAVAILKLSNKVGWSRGLETTET